MLQGVQWGCSCCKWDSDAQQQENIARSALQQWDSRVQQYQHAVRLERRQLGQLAAPVGHLLLWLPPPHDLHDIGKVTL